MAGRSGSREAQSPIIAATSVFGRKWVPVITYHLVESGSLGFSALQSEIGDISNKVLAANLDEMMRMDLVKRRVISDRPFRVEYSLTERGESLAPVVEQMSAWAEQHLLTTEAERPTGTGTG